jgi:hypothetical protein
MPRPKGDFEALYPCDFYEPADLLEADRMYTVTEIARLLQGLEADADVDAETEQVLLDWAVPWIMYRSEELVIAEPPTEDEPGYYGVRRDGDVRPPNDGGATSEDDGRDGDGDGGGDGTVTRDG